jgi:uncharacterized LabA/DUF88 family protein
VQVSNGGGRSRVQNVPQGCLYVDGFNFYFGAIRATPYRWLDFSKLAEALLPEHEIVGIRYFTSRVEDRPNDPYQSQRQDTFIRAIRTISNLTVHEGQFETRPKWMPLVAPTRLQRLRQWLGPYRGRSVKARVLRTQEKASDVNLASYLVLDACRGRFDAAAVVSKDSDLIEPVRIVTEEIGLEVHIWDPQRGWKKSDALDEVATTYTKLSHKMLASCLFPDEIRDAGGTITKPPSW